MSLSKETITLIKELLLKEYDEVTGTVFFYKNQLSQPAKHRVVDREEDSLKSDLIALQIWQKSLKEALDDLQNNF